MKYEKAQMLNALEAKNMAKASNNKYNHQLKRSFIFNSC
jgi:hypothetical protein